MYRDFLLLAVLTGDLTQISDCVSWSRWVDFTENHPFLPSKRQPSSLGCSSTIVLSGSPYTTTLSRDALLRLSWGLWARHVTTLASMRLIYSASRTTRRPQDTTYAYTSPITPSGREHQSPDRRAKRKQESARWYYMFAPCGKALRACSMSSWPRRNDSVVYDTSYASAGARP
jgi:hypothetical protein